MTTIAPGPQTVKSRRHTRRRALVGLPSPGGLDDFEINDTSDGLLDVSPPLDGDTTEYPDWEAVGRSPTETLVVRDFEPVLIRYLKGRGNECFIGSDNFIYYTQGNNKACVSPDVYTLPGVLPDALPTDTPGSNGEGCWKTWLHHTAPNFALEVKAPKNPRKDELQSPARHDALGTKELIVYDPFVDGRRSRRPRRTRFCVYRRDATGVLMLVTSTNDDRVFSEQLGAYLVAQSPTKLRLGLGSRGDDLLPLESERVDMEARRADEEARQRQAEARRADEEGRRADEAARRAEEEAQQRQAEARRADEAARRADEAARRAEEEAQQRQAEARRADEAARRAEEEAQQRQAEARRADEATRRAAELEAELARLRAGLQESPKRFRKK